MGKDQRGKTHGLDKKQQKKLRLERERALKAFQPPQQHRQGGRGKR